MSLASDDPEHVFIVPGRHLAPTASAGSAAAVSGDEIEADLAHEIEADLAHGSEVAGGGAAAHATVALAEAGVALPEGDIALAEGEIATGGDLFRAEVIAERQTQWLGTVLATPRLSHVALALFALAAATAVLCLLVFAGYTRKARVNGWLVPGAGLVRIVAPQPGVLVDLLVSEGAEVAKGAPLAVLSAELQSESVGAVRKEVVRRLADRRDSMAKDRQRHENLVAQQIGSLSRRLETIAEAQAQLQREFGLQHTMLALAEQGAMRQRQLYASRVTTMDKLQEAETDRLESAVRIQALQRERSNLERERLATEAEMRDLPLRSQLVIAEIDRNVGALEQEIAEAEARRRIVITAPQDGTVASVQAEPGGTVSTTVPLITVIPSGARLVAHLFATSRVIGFVRSGQRVLLRYDAFPYQKFGQYQGTVAEVSRSAVSPSELPVQLAGLTSLYGAGAPVYRITVVLARQTVTAYGEAVPLHSGMQVEADVLMERRRLVEWVLDPLFTLTGSWHR